MEDKIINAVAMDGTVRIIAGTTTNLVEKVREIHECTPVAAAALGRMITAGALLGTTLKSDKEIMTLRINGGGEAEGITVTAHENAVVKGFIGNPYGDRPLNEKGKLDVGGYVGKNGNLIIIKDLGMKDPYVGQVPIFSGEIAEDLAYYYTVSEQTPSAVSLGVLVDTDYSIKVAGGLIIQMLPGAEEHIADIVTFRLEEIPTLTEMLSEGKTIEDILNYLFDDMGLKILKETKPEFKCNCSKERVEKALISIGEKDLREIYEDGKDEEVKCHFCNTKYVFTKEQIGELLSKIK